MTITDTIFPSLPGYDTVVNGGLQVARMLGLRWHYTYFML